MSYNWSQCCLSCLNYCCPELNTKRTKYAGVKYSNIHQVEPDGNQSSNLLLESMEKVFTFPQQQSIRTSHPQMFQEETVTQQPTVEHVQRFRSDSVTSTDYSQCVAGVSSKKPVALADSEPNKRSRTLLKSLSIGSSGPSVSSVSSENQPRRRASLPAIAENESTWVLGLPIIEEYPVSEQSTCNMPVLQFSLHYDIQQSTLMVHLHHASNLPAKDRQGTSDPFVVLHLTPNKEETFQSSVIYKTLNPVFDQSFIFQRMTPDDIRHQTLILRIYDHDRFTRNDSIGMIALPLQNADLYGVVMRMIIQDEEKARIKLACLCNSDLSIYQL